MPEPTDRRIHALFDHIVARESEAVRTLLEQGVSAQSEKHGEAALMYAAGVSTAEMVGLLLEYGAAPENPNELPMIEAACGGDIETVHLLRAQGGDVNQRDELGWTPLMEAAYWGYLDIVRALIEAGAEVGAETTNGHTARYVAGGEGHAQIAKILREPAILQKGPADPLSP